MKTYKKYILTQTDGDFEVGTTMFMDDEAYAYIVYPDRHPVGYAHKTIEVDGVEYETIGFRWSFLHNLYDYEAEEVTE